MEEFDATIIAKKLQMKTRERLKKKLDGGSSPTKSDIEHNT